jgi:hypothetical protein
MPKREEPAAEEQKPVITRPRREETEPEQHEETTEHTGNVVFTEDELKDKEPADLEAILTLYQVDWTKASGRNTKAKYTRLILDAQAKAIEAGNTPAGLERFSTALVTGQLTSLAPVGSVTYAMSYTKNLNNYNNAKIQVSVTLPLEPTDEDIAKAQQAVKIARSVVMEQLDADMEELLKKQAE